jgi:hypothetical protein
MNCTCIIFLHRGGKCLDGPAPLHCCVEGPRKKRKDGSIDASAPTRYFQWELRGLVVAYGYEIAEDLVADVGPLLDYFLGGGPSLVPDLAGSEKTPVAPASFDVFDAFEQLGGLVRGSRVLPPYAATNSSALVGMSPPWEQPSVARAKNGISNLDNSKNPPVSHARKVEHASQSPIDRRIFWIPPHLPNFAGICPACECPPGGLP